MTDGAERFGQESILVPPTDRDEAPNLAALPDRDGPRSVAPHRDRSADPHTPAGPGLDERPGARRGSDQKAPSGAICDISELKTACSLPGTLLRVLEVIGDEGGTKKTMVRVIEADPDLTERVLRIANSPLYLTYNDRIDEAPLPVTNLPTAVLKLGFATIRNIAFTQALCGMVRGGHELGVSIVVHLLVVAEVARALGLRQSRSLGEDAYFAGLMHDFGKLALLRTLPLDYLRIAARCESHRIPALRAEEDLLAPSQPLLRNHVQTGAELLRAHGLPEELAVAIERHHDDPALHARDGAAWEVPCIVIIANQLAYFLGYSDGLREDNPAHVSPLDLMGLLGLEQDAFQGIVQEGMSRANDGIVAARLPLKPALMERIKEMGMGAVEPSSDREEDEEMTDDAYGICMTMIDLARSRPRIGFFDFKAHTGLETTTLLSYLDRFTENGYLKTVQADSSRVGYEATRKLHTERPHDILRNVVMDLVEHRPDDARGGEA